MFTTATHNRGSATRKLIQVPSNAPRRKASWAFSRDSCKLRPPSVALMGAMRRTHALRTEGFPIPCQGYDVAGDEAGGGCLNLRAKAESFSIVVACAIPRPTQEGCVLEE